MNKKAKGNFLKKTIQMNIFGVDKDVPVYIIIILIGLIAIFFSARYMLLRDKWHTLNVEWHRYSIDYPALYSTQTYAASGGRGKNLDYLSSSIISFGPTVDIHQKPMENPTLAGATEWWQKTLRMWRRSDISSLVETRIGVGNYPAMMQTYYRGSSLVHAYIVVSDDRSYLIEFERVNETYQPIFDQMLSSFRLYEESDN